MATLSNSERETLARFMGDIRVRAAFVPDGYSIIEDVDYVRGMLDLDKEPPANDPKMVTYIIPAWVAVIMQEVLLEEYQATSGDEDMFERHVAMDLATDILPHGLPVAFDLRHELIDEGVAHYREQNGLLEPMPSESPDA